MQDVFIEWLVKAKTTTGGLAARVAVMCAIPLSVMSVVFLGIYSLVLIFFACYLMYLVWQWTSIEYEYSFCNGEITIDRISGQMNRKRIYTIELKDAEVVAREKSERVRAYNNPDVQVVDYSSGYPSEDKVAICTAGNSGRTKILIEPNEKMFNAMRDFAPNKVFQD